MLEADKRSDYLTNLRTMISDNYIATEFGGRVQNTRERGLPKVMAMIEVSCKTGYHIRELRQLIYNTSFEIKEKGIGNNCFEGPTLVWLVCVFWEENTCDDNRN